MDIAISQITQNDIYLTMVLYHMELFINTCSQWKDVSYDKVIEYTVIKYIKPTINIVKLRLQMYHKDPKLFSAFI